MMTKEEKEDCFGPRDLAICATCRHEGMFHSDGKCHYLVGGIESQSVFFCECTYGLDDKKETT